MRVFLDANVLAISGDFWVPTVAVERQKTSQGALERHILVVLGHRPARDESRGSASPWGVSSDDDPSYPSQVVEVERLVEEVSRGIKRKALIDVET